MSKTKGKSDILRVRVSEKEKQEIADAAKLANLDDMSSFVRLAVREKMERVRSLKLQTAA